MCSTPALGHSISTLSPTRQVSHLHFCNTNSGWSTVHCAFVLDVFCSAFIAYSGHDCGLYVMAFMDVLSIKTDRLYFDPSYARHIRDLCLLSIVQGHIAHFPKTLQGTSIFFDVLHIKEWYPSGSNLIGLQGRILPNAHICQHQPPPVILLQL